MQAIWSLTAIIVMHFCSVLQSLCRDLRKVDLSNLVCFQRLARCKHPQKCMDPQKCMAVFKSSWLSHGLCRANFDHNHWVRRLELPSSFMSPLLREEKPPSTSDHMMHAIQMPTSEMRYATLTSLNVKSGKKQFLCARLTLWLRAIR